WAWLELIAFSAADRRAQNPRARAPMICRHRPSMGMTSLLVVLGIGGGSVPAILPGDSHGAADVLTSPGSDQAQQVTELRRLGGTVFERDGSVVEVNLNRTGVKDRDLDRLAGFPAMTD